MISNGNRLEWRGRRRERGRQGPVSRATRCDDLEEIGSRREMLVDLVIRIGG